MSFFDAETVDFLNRTIDSPVTLATVSRIVTNGADSGAGSLRGVLAAANAGDTITFAANVTTVTLTASLQSAADLVFSNARRSAPIVLAGTGPLVLSGTDTLDALTIGGNAVLRNAGTITQTGDIAVGDATAGTARIVNAAGATWNITDGFNLVAGSATASFDNAGTLVLLAPTDIAKLTSIGVNIVNTTGGAGVIEADVQTVFAGANNRLDNQLLTGAPGFSFSGGRTVVGAGTGFATGIDIGSKATFVLDEDVTIPNVGLFDATIDLANHLLLVLGSCGFGSGSIVGTGRLISKNSISLGNNEKTLTIGGSVLVRSNQYSFLKGLVVLGDASGAAQMTNAPGASMSISGLGGFAAGNALSTFNNAGSISKSGGLSTIGVSFTNLAGTATSMTIRQFGTLAFTGVKNSFVATAISGQGTFAIGGGGASTISGGTTIATAAWTIAKVGTTVSLGQDLAFAGAFTDTNRTTLALGAQALTLSGSAAFVLGPAGAPVVTGSGKLVLGAGGTVGGLTLGGSTLLRLNGGTVDQTGAVTLGDASGGAARLTVAAGATWTLDGDVGISAGNPNASINLGGGTLSKTAASGTRSVVAAAITNLSTDETVIGTVKALAGKLELAGTLSGNLDLRLANKATLLVDKAAGAGVWAYLGSGTTLQLNDAPDFAGQINGFTAGTSNLDLRSIGYGANTAATVQGKVMTITDGTHTAHLTFSNTLAQDSLHLANDGMNGTLVTYG